MPAWTNRAVSAGLLALFWLWPGVPGDAAAQRIELRASAPAVGLAEAAHVAASVGPSASAGDPLGELLPPNDPAYGQQWGDTYVQWPLHMFDAVGVWARYPGRYFAATDRPQDAPLVAVIDTGVDAAHPDFVNQGGASADAAEGGQLALTLALTFLSGDPLDLCPDVTDEHGHGTHLAGIIAAAANNGLTAGSGIAGLAYPVRLVPLKVAGADGAARHSDIARAILYAADQGASVILIALSGPTWSQTLQDAVDYAWDRGCLLVAPAGDAMQGLTCFPAACPHVFGVAGLTESGLPAWYSGQGDWIALAAPGGDESVGIYACLPTYPCTLRQDALSPAYGWLWGTSQAAAHVAAAAGLYAGLAGSRPDEGGEGTAIWQALQRSALPLPGQLPGEWRPDTGRGRLAPSGLLAASPGEAVGAGSLVGRVLMEGKPACDAVVTAVALVGDAVSAAATAFPTGAYRIRSLVPSEYRVTAAADGRTGEWERVELSAGCDLPGLDFRLGDPAAGASVISTQIPAAARRGETMQVSMTLENAGESTWRRADGYRLKQVDPASPFAEGAPDLSLRPGEEVVPGESYAFSCPVPVPDVCAFCGISWQMCQEGGQGRFGPVLGATVSVTSFLDVPADHWAIAEIEAARAAGLVKGYPDGTYHPVEALTRDQMAVYMSRALAGGDEHVPEFTGRPTFPDVPEGFWAVKYVEYAVAQHVVAGYDDGSYHPEYAVTRDQMAVYVARALVAPSGEAALADYVPAEPRNFPDVGDTFWAYEHIEYCVEQGVVRGYDDGYYHPEWVVTRDQMAVYVARAFELG